MTEEQWLSCDDWRPMIAYLSGKISKRKGMLYVCAGLRCISHLLYHDNSRLALETAERAADGMADEREMQFAEYDAEGVTFGQDFDAATILGRLHEGEFSDEVKRLIEMGVWTEADIREGRPPHDPAMERRLLNAADIAYYCLGAVHDARFDERLLRCMSSLAEWPGGWLVREVFGNPIRAIDVKPDWLAWKRGTIAALARGIYDDHAFDRMPILADALEDAGCHDADLLRHSRQENRHLRGCWVIDLLLGLQ